MLTHEVIKFETEALADVLKAGNIQIPSLWSCLWPGLLYATGLVVFTFSISQADNLYSNDGAGSIVFNVLLGFMLSLGMFRVRSLYLSIPASFRNDSQVIKMLTGKAQIYFIVYCLLSISIGVFVGSRELSTMIFIVPHMFIVVFMALIFNADISRYHLSAMMSVMGLLKKRQ